MKKLNILICVLLLVFALTACGNTVERSETTTTTASATVSTAMPISTTVPESSLLIVENKPSITETTSVITTTVITTQATTAYTTTEASTTEAITTAPPVTSKPVTTEKETTSKPSATKAVTGTSFTTRPTTTKPTTTVKQTTTEKQTTEKAATTKPATTKNTTTIPVTQTTSAKKYCTVRIECNTIYDNISKLKNGKQAFLPASGVILGDVQVVLNGGESAFDVIKKACEENVCTDDCQYCKASGVQIEYTYTPAFNNYYIEGIHQIYEKDCGTQSGWMYSVNGVFPDVGTSSYIVSPGDVIVFAFTCNMGEDIGNIF